MTGAEMLSYVKEKFVRDDKDTQIYTALTDIVADIKYYFQAEDAKEEAYVSGISTIGEYKIGVPSDFGQIIGKIEITETASDEYYEPLSQISKEQYDDMATDRLLSDTGKMLTDIPRYFCVFANQIHLYPVPDKTTYQYKINYTTEDTSAITSATDPVPFCTNYKERNIVRNGVLMELYDGLDQFEEANYYRALYQQGKEEFRVYERQNLIDSQNVKYSGC